MGRNINEVNVSIGARIRAQRESLGLSQKAVGEMLGVSYQQIQKFESGRDRLKVEQLKVLADRLDTTQSYLLNGKSLSGLAEDGAAFDGADALAIEKAHELTRAFLSLRSPAMRDAVLELTRRLVAAQAADRSL